MNSFKLDSYYRKDERGIHFGSTHIEFKDDHVVLYDGYEWDDQDGDHILEGDDYWTIKYKYFQRLLFLMPNEYKNKSVLIEYENAIEYYNNTDDETEKDIFICVLNCYKAGSKFDIILQIIDKDDFIHYEHESMRY